MDRLITGVDEIDQKLKTEEFRRNDSDQPKRLGVTSKDWFE